MIEIKYNSAYHVFLSVYKEMHILNLALCTEKNVCRQNVEGITSTIGKDTGLNNQDTNYETLSNIV